MGKLKEFLIDQENAKNEVKFVLNTKQVECPTCKSHDVMIGELNSICLECNLVDDTGLFVTKIDFK